MPIVYTPPRVSSGGGLSTASNGLTAVGVDVQLGGTLTSDVNVLTNGNALYLGSDTGVADSAGFIADGNEAIIQGRTTGVTTTFTLNGSTAVLDINDTGLGQDTQLNIGSGQIIQTITDAFGDNSSLFQLATELDLTVENPGVSYSTIVCDQQNVTLGATDEVAATGKSIVVGLGQNYIVVADTHDSNGMEYFADYAANNVTNDRWIPDKAYVDATAGGGGIGGSGTAGTVPKFTAATTLGDSLVSDSGTKVSVGGDFEATGLSLFTDGTQGFYMGGYGSNNYGAMWPQNVTPGSTNYTFIGRDDTTYLNSSGVVGLSISDNFVFGIDAATVYAAQPVHAYGGMSRFTDGTNGVWIGQDVSATTGALYNYADTPGSGTYRLLFGGANTVMNALTTGGNVFAVNGTEVAAIDTDGMQIIGTMQTGIYPVGGLPALPATGARAMVNDALAPVFGSAVVGGGSVVTPVFYNGSTWIVG
jgi:hypothetical protein